MYTCSTVNISLISDRKSSHILEQNYLEYGEMYDRSMLTACLTSPILIYCSRLLLALSLIICVFYLRDYFLLVGENCSTQIFN